MPIIKAEGLAKSDGVVFKTIPEGEYSVRISGIEDREAKTKNGLRSMLDFKLQVEPGQDNEGHTLNLGIFLPHEDDNATKRQMSVDSLKRLCIACGINTESDEFDTDALYGASFKAIVTKETVEGKEYNRVRDYLPL